MKENDQMLLSLQYYVLKVLLNILMVVDTQGCIRSAAASDHKKIEDLRLLLKYHYQ